ncbi:MAG TPA: PhaM family polyhydroxyalkanoate granule multifunctional regulatory protein [Casimicrobiaceae bacterium]|nr:PhaM family polyhydroxyalkanoate granule multifunctional regulatory protein [Casimicrobiaceae bacterium]
MTKPADREAPAPGAFPTPQQALEFMQKMWNPLGVPIPGFGLPGAMGAPVAASPTPAPAAFPNPAMMFAALDPVEVERKIGELRVIENWLAMSLSMMQMSIKTLELQKASLEALHGSAAGSGAGRKKGGG